MKVIASSLRKGNIVELDDGKLYVVLNAESFHPGKGTPTTQVDMRRISDGVKTAQRYKTTEQVERAHVEEQDFTFLYQDGDGFHFMNAENYDQVTLQTDMIGDQAAYLAPEMKVQARRSTTACRSRSHCRRRRPWKWSRPSRRSRDRPPPRPTSRPSCPTAFAPWSRPFVATGTKIVVMTADGSYVERAKD